ncbi:MAG: TatD family hydrolase [Dehalococcoidales bacterium]|nr:TatD family hydrolase [Dehalococcoidales bacterium]
MLQLIDTHAHIEQLADLPGALEQAKDNGVVAIIGVGMDEESNRKILQIAAEHPGFIYPAFGWHPWELRKETFDRTLSFIETNIGQAVAIGEIGLDYHKKVKEIAPKDFQHIVLKELLNLAKKYGKPVLLHSRYAWHDALDLVTGAGIEKAVFHWYTGPSSVLRGIVNQGYYLSATPSIEYHEEHRRAVKEIPLDKLLLETDSPVVYGRGREFEFESRPADVRRSLSGAAILKDLPPAQLAAITTTNARKLFPLPEI